MIKERRLSLREKVQSQPTLAHQDKLGGRVLLAEDNAVNQKLIARILSNAGLEVEVADNGQIACEKALRAADGQQPYGVILMDMQMPVMDGYTATKRLRSEGCRTPIIAITAHAMQGDRDRCIEAGCDDYATKPIGRSKLIALLGQYLNQEKSDLPPASAA